MALEGAEEKREQVTRFVLYALEHSPVSKAVSTQVLQRIVDAKYSSMLRGERLQLQPLWDMLSSQPEITMAHVEIPMVVVKQYEKLLGLQVELPENMSHLQSYDISSIAKNSSIRPSDARAVIKTEAEPDAKARKKHSSLSFETPASKPDTAANEKKPRSKGVLYASVIVAVLSFGFVAVSLIGFMSTGAERATFSAQFGNIPVATSDRFGDEVGITLSSDTWLNKDQEAIEKQLGVILKGLRGQGVKTLFIRDSDKNTKVIAQWSGSPPTLEIRYP